MISVIDINRLSRNSLFIIFWLSVSIEIDRNMISPLDYQFAIYCALFLIVVTWNLSWGIRDYSNTIHQENHSNDDFFLHRMTVSYIDYCTCLDRITVKLNRLSRMWKSSGNFQAHFPETSLLADSSTNSFEWENMTHFQNIHQYKGNHPIPWRPFFSLCLIASKLGVSAVVNWWLFGLK